MKLLSSPTAVAKLFSAAIDCAWECTLVDEGPWRGSWLSGGFADLTAYSSAWLAEDFRRWRQLTHPHDAAVVNAAVDRFLASEHKKLDQEYRVVRADGDVRWVHVRLVVQRDASGRAAKLFAAVQDVTEYKSACVQSGDRDCVPTDLLESVAAGVVLIDGTRQVTFANRAAAELLGVSCAELVGRPWMGPQWQVASIDGRRASWDAAGPQATDTSEVHLRITRTDDSVVFIRGHESPLGAQPVRDAGTIVTLTDDSARRHAEEELQRRERWFRALIERSSDAIVLVDMHGTLLHATPAAEHVLGLSQAEFVGINGFTLLHPGDVDAVREEFAKLIQDPTQLMRRTVRVRSKSGRYRFIEAVVGNHLADSAVQALVVNFRDVTQREHAAKALRESDERFRSLFEQNLAGVFRTRLDGTIMECNDACARIFGFTAAAQMIGRSAQDFYVAETERSRLLAQVFRLGTVNSAEVQMCKRDRTPVWVLENITIRQDGDAAAFFEGTLIDITERKRIEEQLHQARKMEALGQLAGSVAHDFNNLLTAMLGNLSLIADALPESHATSAYLRETEKAASRAAELTAQLLGFARRRTVNLQPTALDRIINEVVALLRRTLDARVEVIVQLPPDLDAVMADSGQLHSALLNLVLNARDAMPHGGTLSIAATNLFVDEHYAAFHAGSRAGEFVRVRVEDSGCGMTPEVRQRIFEPFFTTKEPGKGTGLGLAMAFGVMQQHQGWITCDSEPGRGTRFDLFLPKSIMGVHNTGSLENAPRGGTETILVVDDDDMVRQVTSTILRSFGYTVVEAADGERAIQCAEATPGKFDLVLLDLVMPGLSGRETFYRLRQREPQVRVIFSSGCAAELMADDIVTSGCGTMTKPFRARDLARAVRALLDHDADVGMNL